MFWKDVFLVRENTLKSDLIFLLQRYQRGYVYIFMSFLGCDFFRKYTDTQIRIRTHRNIFFQTVSNNSFLIFLDFLVILLSSRYADTQIRRYADSCFRLLAIVACLFTKIDFLLSKSSTKIDFCGATGHDHGGW